MNRSWRELRVMLKWRFPFLSDEYFTFEEDKNEKMLDKLAARLHKTRSDLDLPLGELQRF